MVKGSNPFRPADGLHERSNGIKYEENRRKVLEFSQKGLPLTGSGERVGENLATENISFNVLTHELVPEHYLLSEEEAQQILDKLKIANDFNLAC